MMPLKLEDILQAVNGKIADNIDLSSLPPITGIATDTRELKQGQLFVPIKGERFDGHDFLPQAFEKGAICCLSEAGYSSAEKCVIYVENTRKALGDLAKYYLSLFSIPVVAITGSVGKTTTKDMIASVLEQKYQVLKTQGNFNNDIGLPKTIFQLENHHQVLVLEMGMNHFGEIQYLSQIARPDIAVITNVGVSHIENLGSREGILQAKCEIFDGLKKNGIILLNKDNDMLRTVQHKTHCVFWYGVSSDSDITAKDINPLGIEGIGCTICMKDTQLPVIIPVPGEHMVLNALAAAGVGSYLGVEPMDIKKGIESFRPTGMRMSVFKTDAGTTIINDAYNANPVSMKAALDVLANCEGRKVAVLGDMFELGPYAGDMHFEVGQYAKEKGIDVIICVGTLAKHILEGAAGGNVFYYETQENFLTEGIQQVHEGDTVLIKASRGMHFEKTAEKIQEVK